MIMVRKRKIKACKTIVCNPTTDYLKGLCNWFLNALSDFEKECFWNNIKAVRNRFLKKTMGKNFSRNCLAVGIFYYVYKYYYKKPLKFILVSSSREGKKVVVYFKNKRDHYGNLKKIKVPVKAKFFKGFTSRKNILQNQEFWGFKPKYTYDNKNYRKIVLDDLDKKTIPYFEIKYFYQDHGQINKMKFKIEEFDKIITTNELYKFSGVTPSTIRKYVSDIKQVYSHEKKFKCKVCKKLTVKRNLKEIVNILKFNRSKCVYCRYFRIIYYDVVHKITISQEIKQFFERKRQDIEFYRRHGFFINAKDYMEFLQKHGELNEPG